MLVGLIGDDFKYKMVVDVDQLDVVNVVVVCFGFIDVVVIFEYS